MLPMTDKVALAMNKNIEILGKKSIFQFRDVLSRFIKINNGISMSVFVEEVTMGWTISVSSRRQCRWNLIFCFLFTICEILLLNFLVVWLHESGNCGGFWVAKTSDCCTGNESDNNDIRCIIGDGGAVDERAMTMVVVSVVTHPCCWWKKSKWCNGGSHEDVYSFRWKKA